MPAPRSVRLAAAAVLGLAAGGAFWVREGGIEPFLEVTTELVKRSDEFGFSIFVVDVKARGGETIDEVRIEPGTGPAGLPPPDARARPALKSGWRTKFSVQVNGPPDTKASVRLVQTARVSRTYDVPLEAKP